MRNNNHDERLSPGKALLATFTLCLICWAVLIAVGEWIAS